MAGEADALGPVGGLGDHVDAGLVVKDEAQPAADHRLVVGEQDADGHGAFPAVTGPVVRGQ